LIALDRFQLFFLHKVCSDLVKLTGSGGNEKLPPRRFPTVGIVLEIC